MDQKEFCLKWNSYSDVFQGTFATLLRNERFTDLTLSCEGQTIKCHKVVLSACSSYFENLLLDTAHPHPIIILRDVRFRDMQALVKFMYTGEVTVAQAQINSLIKVADLLKIKGLADPDESPDPVEQEPEPLPEKKTVTPPPAKRKRVEPRIEPEAENNFLQDPLQDLVPSNKRMSSVPVASVLEASSSSAVQVQPEEASDSPLPLNFKEEVADFSLEADDSSSQYEDQGDDFDYGNDNLVPGETNDKGEAGPSSGVNPAGIRRFWPKTYQKPNKNQILAAISEVERGFTIRQAAEKHDVSPAVVGYHMKKMGKRTPQKGRPKKNFDELMYIEALPVSIKYD